MMAWKEGDKLGQYILGKQVGQGGMATVYLAHHPQLDRQVAIKVMHQNFLDDETFVARFKREAQIVAKLTHPHIVSVYDYDEHEGLPYLVMKYVQGNTLKQAMIKNPLSLDEILYVISAVGSALSYAHREGVLHRDIKPSNIVIDKDKTPYLTDFGLARLAASGESTMSADMLLGTPHYISPEQARGMKDLDGRTDIYSLGVVLYELLVGHVPYTGDTPYSIIHDHIYSPLPMPSQINPEIPSAVEMVLYRALEKRPEDRYATADDLVRDLRESIQESSLQELNPDRVSAASVSIAKARADFDNELTITPSGGKVSTPYPTPSGLRTGKIISQATKKKNEGRTWAVGGCASLLVIFFLTMGIFLSMSQNILELQALTNDGDNTPNVHDMLFFPNGISSEYARLGVRVDDADFPSLIIPDVPVADIPENPTDAIGALIRARGLYSLEDIDGARQTIVSNIPSQGRAVYLSSAAQLAEHADDLDAALILSVAAFESARQENPEFLALIRPHIGEYVYNTAGTSRRVSITATLQAMSRNGLIGDDTMATISDSPITAFAIARNLSAAENYRLAQVTLRNATGENPLDAEYALLQGEIALGLGNTDEAQSFWESIDEMDDVPQWIENRANDLLDSLD